MLSISSTQRTSASRRLISSAMAWTRVGFVTILASSYSPESVGSSTASKRFSTLYAAIRMVPCFFSGAFSTPNQ